MGFDDKSLEGNYTIQTRDEGELYPDHDGPSVLWRILDAEGGILAQSRVAYWSQERAIDAAKEYLRRRANPGGWVTAEDV